MDTSKLIPQTISPTAYQIAQFGRTPISYFYGLPQISIPLTEVRGRGYGVPVALSYHGGGIKPDQHPGWVGLGWSLQAGGCITRVTRGMKDEMSKEEYDFIHASSQHAQLTYDPGYIYHMEEIQSGEAWTEAQLYNHFREDMIDFEPDEYIVNVPGISTSFVIVGEHELRVISRDESAITLERYTICNDESSAMLNMYPGQGNDRLKANRFKYIKEFVLRDKEGNRYLFGGTDGSIEYSIAPYPVIELVGTHYENTRIWKAAATATSWMLTRIERADGEVFEFSYEHDGVPIVLHDIHHGCEYTTDESAPSGLNPYLGRFEHHFDTYSPMPSAYKYNLSFSFLMPCYLKNIRSLLTGDTLYFETAKTTELSYEYQQDDFTTYVADLDYEHLTVCFSYQDFQLNNYYRKLVRVYGEKRDIRLDYTNNAQERLKLTDVRILRRNDNGDIQVDGRYSFEYNSTRLPGYNSRKTDVWGYYNSETGYSSRLGSFGQGLDELRVPSALLMAAEILVAVHYPTGGWTNYEWEPHCYGTTVFPPSFSASQVEESIAGGLRIKSITDHSDGVHSSTRSFDYLNECGTSSGVLTAFNTCRVEGCHSVNTSQVRYYSHFAMYSEMPILPLSETDGCHVTYSQVRETFDDGGYIEYRYTNSQDGSCCDHLPDIEIGRVSGCPIYPRLKSYALFRGLLVYKNFYDSDGILVRSESMTYGDVGPSYYASAAADTYCGQNMVFLYYSRERCGYPALTSHIVTERTESGMGLTDEYQYSYNSMRLLTSEIHSRSGYVDSTRYYYPADRSGAPYENMVFEGFIGAPVETVKMRSNLVVDAQKVEYTAVTIPSQNGTGLPQTRETWLPSKVFSGKFISPVSLQDYLVSPLTYLQDTPDVEIKIFDETAFPCYAIRKDGCAVELFRSARHGEVAMSVMSQVRGPSDQTVSSTFKIPLTPSVLVQESFETSSPSTSFTCSIAPSYGYAMLLEVKLDQDTHNVAIWCIGSTPNSHWMPLISNYPSPLTFSVPAGSHSLSIRSVEVYIQGGSSQVTSCGSLYVTHSRSGQFTFGSKFIDLDVDAESGQGFHCTKGHYGPLTVSHTTQAGRQYVLDYMERAGNDSPWSYRRTAYSGGNVTIGGSGKTVSCVRFYPCDTLPESYCLEEFSGVAARTDARGISESYEFDALGRLHEVFDNNGRVLSRYAYEHATAGAVPATGNYDNVVRSSVITDPAGTAERVAVSHMDGLGRPIQEVLAAGGAGVDLVTNVEYDAAGREKRKWIPIPVPYGSGRTSGDLVSESLLRNAAVNVYPCDNYLFNENEYEASPRDRVTAVRGPGIAWASAQKRTTHRLYINNTQTGPLYHRGFTVVRTSSGWILRRNASVTAAGQLSVTNTVSEDNESMYEFRDFRGDVVMVRRGNDNDTHYVYDELGHLSAVLPPKLVSNLESSGLSEWTWSEISDLAFLYRYDSRSNCIAKNIPGAGWTYMAYDKGGRCVFTQDEIQRPLNQWTFLLTDIYGRPCVTGTAVRIMDAFTDPIADVNVFATMPSSPSYNGELKGYTLSGLSSVGNSVDILTINYYDGYGFLGNGAFPATDDARVAYDMNTGTDYGARYVSSDAGLLTGQLIKVLESGTSSGYLWTVMYYDDRGRVVQKRASTHLNGVDKDYFGYDFTGVVTAHRTVHSNADGSSFEERTTYTYDNMRRPLVTRHKVGTNMERTVLTRTYDQTGRMLTTGHLSLPSATQTYSYNIRSWLTGISGDLFTEVLGYHSGLVPRYDGKISSISWKSGAETSLRKYELSYDNLARLVSADYSESSIPQAFDETYEYDANGNMVHLLRKGLNSAGTAVTTIKNIAITLTGNRMTAIGGSACSHDAKGRMTACTYGEAWTATYNILDLPQSETVGTKSISRKYGANGVKLQEKITENGSITTRDYVGNCIYENGALKKILFEGGYTEMNGNIPSYRFFLIDHLGSVRAVIDEIGSTCQINQYYPFGDLINDPRLAAGSQDNRFRYTGKELVTESGQYDFRARFLSPLVGRFNTVDPLAEKYYDVSPYAYCNNNPTYFVDNDGKDPIYAKSFWGKVKRIGDDGKKSTGSYLVKSTIARKVKKATKAGEFYSGDLSEGKRVMHIPTGKLLEGVKQSYEDTKRSQRENGGHSIIGENTVTFWDEGPVAVSFIDKEGNPGAKASLRMFVINGVNTMPSNASNVKTWWHIHPNTTVNGIALGDSVPSEADLNGQRRMVERGYKGNSFVVGTRTDTVTFFNENRPLITVDWEDFLRMGGQEQ